MDIKSHAKIFMLGFIAALFLSGAVAGGFIFGTKFYPQTSLEGQKNLTPIPTSSPTQTPMPTPTSQTAATSNATLDAIDKAFTSKDFSGLSDIMKDNLIVGIYASECCGKITKADAILKLTTYFKSAKLPWTFSPTNAVTQALAKANPENFKDAVVGIAQDRHTVSLKLSANFLIEKITLMTDYKLLVP